MLQFTFLGTSSGVPSLTRNVSGLAIHLNKSKDWILVDAGEGTQHRIQQAKFSLQHLKAICITHVHGDHCYGLMGLLASAGMNGRKEPLTIIAPKNIQTWFEATQTLTDLYLPYALDFIDVATLASEFDLNENIQIKAHALHHRVPSYAFSIFATQTQSKLNVEALQQIGLPKGKAWGDLQQGKTVEWQGQYLKAQDYQQTVKQHVQAVVGGDNDQPELLTKACKNAQLLIHESTYNQATLDKVGSGPMHSSVKMVAEFAEDIQLPNLILTHFSARYHDATGIKILEDEAKQFYHGHLFMAADLKTFELNAQAELICLN